MTPGTANSGAGDAGAGDAGTGSPATEDLARIAARAADAKKGEEIVILDVGDIMGIVGSFVIVGAANTRLVRTIVEEVEHALTDQAAVKPRAVEGLDDCRWVLLDYGDLVVHVFLDETREFYGLERLWADAARVPWQAAV